MTPDILFRITVTSSNGYTTESTATREEMLADSEGNDDPVVDFVKQAAPGDKERFGGGAAPLFEIECFIPHEET